MTQSYTTEYHHLLILLISSVILMLSRLGSASGSWNSTRPSVSYYGLRLSTSQLRHLTRFTATHLNWLSPPSIYLGVTIDSKLNFNNHIDSVAKKANGTRAFLNSNLRSCSYSIRDSTYKTYIRPMLSMLPPCAQDPHTRRNTNKLEQVQRHSARYVTGNHD